MPSLELASSKPRGARALGRHGDDVVGDGLRILGNPGHGDRGVGGNEVERADGRRRGQPARDPLTSSGELQVQVVLRHAVGFAMFGNQVAQVLDAALRHFAGAVAGVNCHMRRCVDHHLVQVGRQDDARAAIICSRDLLAEIAAGKTAGARIELRIDLLQDGDVAGEHDLFRANERIHRMAVGRYR